MSSIGASPQNHHAFLMRAQGSTPPDRNGDLGDDGGRDLAGEQRANQSRDDAERPLSQVFA